MALIRVLPFLAVLALATGYFNHPPFSVHQRRTSRRPGVLTRETGVPISTNQFSLTATAAGGILLQDAGVLEKLRRFNSERIAERVVHAQGVGALGTFTATADISSLTRADFLRRGRRTPMVCRFSTVTGKVGSVETARDPRGFSCKFRTREGNFDLVNNNFPVFFIRDHQKFPDLVHAVTDDPVTNLPNVTRAFDFFSALGGEATHMLTFLFSDLGIPAGYRFMDGNSVHAYKFVNRRGRFTYVKFRWASQQGIRNLTSAEAQTLQGTDTRHLTRDLIEAIRRGDFPKWDLRIQTITPAQLDDFDFNPLDATKVWPERLIPSRKIGELVLNRVPRNFFLETERMAFDPGNFIPGAIEPSEDRLLQGRLISYHESQEHRFKSGLFNRLPVNRPIVPLNTYSQGGVGVQEHDWEGSVNYEPNNDPNAFVEAGPRFLYSRLPICGTYQQREIEITANFAQAGETFRSFSTRDQENLVANLGGALSSVPMNIRNTMCAHFLKADTDYGRMVIKAASCNAAKVRVIAKKLSD